jgi:hypothetical protein
MRDLCKRIGLSIGGRTIADVKEALHTLMTTSLFSERAYYHKPSGHRVSNEKGFHIYDMVVFVNESMPDGSEAQSNYVWLNQMYLSNINAQYVKPISRGYYWGLKKLMSRRLYEILSVKFYGMRNINEPLIQSYRTLCDLMCITPQKYMSDAKKTMKAAHQELIGTEFLASAEWESRGRGPDKRYVLYTAGQRALDEIEGARTRGGQQTKVAKEAISQTQDTTDWDQLYEALPPDTKSRINIRTVDELPELLKQKVKEGDTESILTKSGLKAARKKVLQDMLERGEISA